MNLKDGDGEAMSHNDVSYVQVEKEVTSKVSKKLVLKVGSHSMLEVR